MSIYDNKAKHLLSVARLMYQIAVQLGWGEEKAREMFLLGYIHEVAFDSNYKYAAVIEKHGCKMNKNSPPELILLNSADLQVDMYGNTVGFDKCLEDICSRYGKDSRQANNAKYNIEICRNLGFYITEKPDNLQ